MTIKGNHKDDSADVMTSIGADEARNMASLLTLRALVVKP
jgi:hypothetical protein